MKVVITGGGTAGHAYPAISIGTYLRDHMNVDLFYIGNENYIESKIAMQNGIEFHSIQSQGMEGKNKFEKYGKFAMKNSKGVIQALKILKKINPDFVLGTGGFVSAPVLTAAIMLKIPYAIHEQNSVMGKVNNLFKNKAQNVFYSFPVKEEGNARYTGCPVRFNFELERNGGSMVFIGGSGGSRAINQAAIKFATENPDIPCVLISGKALYEEVMEEAGLKNIKNLEIVSYADNMKHYYGRARVVVCRSGAGTVFEATNLNIPMILVPLPTSAENHQYKNAEFFAEKDAAILIEEGKFLAKELNDRGRELFFSDIKLRGMKENLRKLAKMETSKHIASIIERETLETQVSK